MTRDVELSAASRFQTGWQCPPASKLLELVANFLPLNPSIHYFAFVHSGAYFRSGASVRFLCVIIAHCFNSLTA